MKYYLSSAGDWEDQIMELKHNTVLLSFGVDAPSHWKVFKNFDVLIDSGAFSIYNSGVDLNIDDYVEFTKQLPQHWNFISFDVIPKDKKSKVDVDKCGQATYENYLYLKDKIPNLWPVYHYGEDIKYFKKYMELTDKICVGSLLGNKIKSYHHYNQIFSLAKDKIKIHGLAMTSVDFLFKFPFYSVDSITYKRVNVTKNVKYWGQGEFKCLGYESLRYWFHIEQQVTNIWKHRGVIWN